MCFAERVWLEPPMSAWTDVVFHVLAQLPGPRVPASLHSPWYAEFVAALLGPAQARQLGADLAALAAVARDHHTLVAMQQLAWLWRDPEQALACADRELSQLRAEDVAEPALLPSLLRSATAVELLRCAALLELEAYRRLPAPELDLPALSGALAALVPLASGLTTARITSLRPLTRHGRVRGASIFIGVPGAGVSLAHAAFQAAHEATVREVEAHGAPLAERRIESIALVLLATRAERARARGAHRSWCAEHGVRDVDLRRANLTVEERKILDACLH